MERQLRLQSGKIRLFKRTSLILPIVLVTWLAAGSAPAQMAMSHASGATLTIGVIQMLTGSSGFYGQALLKGNELAVDQLNAKGGILGKKIVVMSADNASDNAQTVNLARKFGQMSSIPAIIAPTYQPNMEAACAVSTQLGIAQIAGQSAPPPANVNSKGYCFVNSTNIVRQVQQTIKFVAHKYHVTTFAQVYDQQNAYQTQFDKVGTDYIEASGFKIVQDIGVNTGVTDYGPQITSLIHANPQVVMPNLTTEDAARFMQQARARGLKALFVGPNASLVNARLYSLSRGAAAGLIVSTNQSTSQKTYRQFFREFVKKFGHLDDPVSGFGYDSMMILAKAIAKAGSTNRNAIKKGLQSFHKLCASICYTYNGHHAFIARSLFYQKLTKNGWVPIS